MFERKEIVKDLDINEIYERLNNIEEMLKLLIVNSLMDDFKIKEEQYNESSSCRKEITDTLDLYCIKLTKMELNNGFELLYLSLDENVKYTMNDFIYLNEYITEIDGQYIPVFCFNSLNGMRRKRLTEEGISYQVTNKELFIFKK